jgi:hypothetical protein
MLIISSLFVMACLLQVQSMIDDNVGTAYALDNSLPNNSNPVKLILVHTIPSQVHVGDIFKINATAVNNSPKNIVFTFIGCTNPLSAAFDNNVLIIQHGVCTVLRLHQVTLAAGKSTTLSTPLSLVRFVHQYKAINPGKTNGTLQLSYSQLLTNKTLSYEQPFELTILPKIT